MRQSPRKALGKAISGRVYTRMGTPVGVLRLPESAVSHGTGVHFETLLVGRRDGGFGETEHRLGRLSQPVSHLF